MNTHNTIFQNHHFESKNEIDLLKLCIILWSKRKSICAVVAICVIPVAIWLMLQASIYRLEALFGSTSAYDIQALQPTSLPDGARYEVSPLKSEDVYQDLLTQAGSLNTQRIFWEQWSGQPLTQDPNSKTTKNDDDFKVFFNSLRLIPATPKNPSITFSQINLETADPARDIKTLTAYVVFLNNRVVEKFVSQLEKAYESNLKQLQFDYAVLQKREKQKLEDDLIQLQESESIARSLNIVDTPYDKLAGIELKVMDDRRYLLGTKALQQEIKSLQVRSEQPLSAFVPDLRNMEYWQEILKNDIHKLQTVKSNVQILNLISPVVSSLDPIKPKKWLILLAVLFLSLLIGSVIALAISGIKNYQEPLGNNT